MAKTRNHNDDVIRAGLALLDAGHPINGWALRTKLGGGRSNRLMAIWLESPEGKRAAIKPPKGAISNAVIQKAISSISDAARTAIEELDRSLSETVAERDARHATELADATKWAEGFEERISSQVADWTKEVQEARSVEASLREQLAVVTASRDEMSARLAAAEDRERTALQRAARAEGQLAASDH